MAEIFMSWGSPDSEVVPKLRDRLKNLGFNVWEYSEDMQAGAQIPSSVLDRIYESSMAIVCLSDETAKRDWITSEVAWIRAAREKGSLKHVIPVQVGPLAKENVPHLLASGDFYLFDLSKGDAADDDLRRLAGDISELLDLEAPLVVPAALFSMTMDESLKLFEEMKSPLWDLCQKMGMDSPPELFDYLKKRYGPTPQDLTPFQTNKKLIEILQESLRDVNAARVRERKHPILLRWMTDELTGPPGKRTQAARDMWKAGDSLLIIDSISTFDIAIQTRLLQLPASEDPTRAAVLWVPPYTQHTSELESMLEETAQLGGAHIGDVFSDWKNQRLRPITFDTGTSVALRIWLRRTLTEVSDEQAPIPSNLNSLPNASRPVRLKDMLQLPQQF